MSVEIHGEGKAELFLVPGGPGLGPGFYRELVEPLARNHRVVTYTTRGSRAEDDRPFPASVKEYAEELLEVVEGASTPDRKSVLLAHSYGVPVAIEALLGDHRFDGAVLISGFDSFGMFVRGMSRRKEQLPEEFHEAYNSLAEGGIRELAPILAEHFYPRHFCRNAEWPTSFLEALGSLKPELVEHHLGRDLFSGGGTLDSWDRADSLGSIELPTLAISGKYDYYPPEDSKAMASKLPRGEVWISEGASHTAWVEDPDHFFPRVEEFLTEIVSESGS